MYTIGAMLLISFFALTTGFAFGALVTRRYYGLD